MAGGPVRVLHLADLHLGWTPRFLGSRAGERQRERDGLLTRAVDWVLTESAADMVVIAGDLFETHRPEPGLLGRVVADLARLVEAGVAVVTVPGNHDEITYHDSVYREYGLRWPGLLVTSPIAAHAGTLSVRGVPIHIYGLAYTGGVTRTPVEEFPRLHVPGLHVAVFHGSLGWNAGDRSLPLPEDALAAASYDYVALGHIHQHVVRTLGNGLAVYPGAVEGKGFDDPGVGFFTVAVLGDGQARLERKPAGSRPVRTVELDVSACRDETDVEGRIRELGDSSAIVRVRLVGASPARLAADELADRLRSCFYHLDIVDETTVLDEAAFDGLAAEPTVRGQFVRRMKAAIEQAKNPDERQMLVLALRRGMAALGERTR
ncbi:MAG: DNA repair exonuclease [Firmicutes bacterium]|nr:DNA repair exonuclease [Bacillota bacterium]